MLKRILASSPEIEVVGTAVNGLEALELMTKVHLDVICTGLAPEEVEGGGQKLGFAGVTKFLGFG
ncbi:MAG: hypothetical protein AB4352_23105 [Hormoscilla sp.]